METTKQNPLLCDPESGVCEMPVAAAPAVAAATPAVQRVKIIYYTDPICSSCWGIEPQLRRLKLEYGPALDIEYRMGGLLPDWSYNSGGISKPADVAHHWDEVSQYYDMPIDGDVWLEDPLASSYPPSIAFKAAQLQDPAKALLFLREMRELVFLRKKNIAKWEHLTTAATAAGLNVAQLKADFDGPAKTLFEQDLALGRQLGVRGFPTLYFVDAAGGREVVYGSKPYATFEAAVLKLNPAATKSPYGKTWQALFSKYATLTAREFAELSGTPRAESEKVLNELAAAGTLEKLMTKNGALWQLQPR
ncbi:DsbA family protein [Hymenobacter gummosus]|uniref:DsbA family protein n=2 Tax=Hymenobacter gummosus TaxID=1776032 RepID=A0A3S0HMB5_9BACT|nr:ClpXP adapter SpxH family protein [Hymenobacter gummosus]RTQ48627.1 DsbA family protein [Hymenobacter gummosus]